MLQEPRSDIIKELNYSRNQMDDCSLIANNYGPSSMPISCTTAEKEVISPCNSQVTVNGKTMTGYCYGQKLSIPLGGSITDNWFCATPAKNQR